jgi:hypothetical protein
VKMARGRAEARWLPSRHRFAIARLYAFLRLRGAKPEPREGLMMVVDRDQTAFEHHGVSLWIVATVACYLAASLFRALPLPAALLVSIPVAAIVVEVPVVSGGFLFRGRANGVFFMILFTAVSAYFARQTSWVRFAAWQVFAVMALNAIAAAILLLLREPIARLERGVLSES